MPSRAESSLPSVSAEEVSADRVLPAVGATLHGIAVVCVVLVLWVLASSPARDRLRVTVSADGSVDTPLPALLRTAAETLDVQLTGVPDARLRATLRALRGGGRVVHLSAPRTLLPLAVAAEEEWRATGATRIQLVAADSALASLGDAAGLIDSVRVRAAGLHPQSGPVQGALRVDAGAARAAVAPLVAGAPSSARVLVLGSATWESRFLIATLEEGGWPVDAGVTLSPRVTIVQGPAPVPSRARHAVVVLLPGAATAAVSKLPAFVRDGGGLVIVGESSRMPGLMSLRAGTPGATVTGELGAEASDDPRHGLDLVPITSLAEGSVVLESRDGKTAVVARRVGAGRVMQVGYVNSWLWRMAGNDDAPIAHRRWWTSLLSGVVPLSAPVARLATVAGFDSLDAAPVAALSRDLGLPLIGETRVRSPGRGIRSSLEPIWLLLIALASIVASWVIRRWRGLV